jgi:Mrp family chromosome partitioning ATPase
MNLDEAGNSRSVEVLPDLEQVSAFKWDANLANEAKIVGFDSRNIRSRPFNLLRSRILKLAETRGWRSFGIVSAAPGAGKSFVACNLAASLSRSPQVQTYLIDADLRRSSVAANFKLTPSFSFNDFLRGSVTALGQIACRPEGERLVIIPSIADQAPSAELLAGKQMDELFRSIKELPRQRLILFDLPPAFANDDAALMASKLDAFLLVVEDGQTTKKQIRETLNMLSPASFAGAILNKYQGGLISDDYGYGYGSGSKYSEYYSEN